MQTQLAILAGKLSATLAKRLRLGAGTSLPGKVARKIDPNLLRKLARSIREQTIAVTGTNGKTTTCGLLAQFLTEGGKRVVHNQLGANMVPGITAALLLQSSLSGKLSADVGVLEVDEASLKGVTSEAHIQRIAVTNLFRDQLDRYGELDTTAKLILKGIEASDVQTSGRLFLNADDPLVASLGASPGTSLDASPGAAPDKNPANVNRTRREDFAQNEDSATAPLYFGVEAVSYAYETTLDCPIAFQREVTNCPRCNATLHYSLMIYGHLGHYRCDDCGYRRPRPTVYAEQVTVSPDGSDIALCYGPRRFSIYLPLPGLFNVYNFLAAASIVYDLGLPESVLLSGLDHYQSVFGRAEKKIIDGKPVMVMLIKNPVGASEVLKLVGSDPKGRLLIALNDNFADGRDVSWIWDAAFELIPDTKPVTVSGIRAEDMAVRLKYAGMSEKNISLVPDLKNAVTQAIQETPAGETLYILPTYTALLSLRNMI